MGETIMRNWDFREFRVRDNLPFRIWQVWLPIWRVRAHIRGLLNPIRQGVPLISHIRSYPPYHSHHHPVLSLSRPQLYQHRRTQSSVILLYLTMPWSWVNTEYSIWRVQHTPSPANTEYSIHRTQHPPKIISDPFVLTIMSRPFNVASSFWCASLQNQLPPASWPWELKGKVTLSHSHGCELTNWWIESQHPAVLPSTTPNLARSWPQSVSPNSLHHGLRVHLHTRSIMASKCIWVTQSRPPSASPYSLDLGLQVHLHTRLITAFTFTRSWPPSASLSNMISASKCISKLARSWLPSGHLYVHTITASKCISALTRLSSSGPPRIALKHHLQPVQIYHV